MADTQDGQRLWRYAMMHDMAGVRRELNRGVDVNSLGLSQQSPLQVAINLGCSQVRHGLPQPSEVVGFLLHNNADPNIQDKWGKTALHSCARSGNLDYAKLLVEYGADVTLKDLKGQTALHVCAKAGAVEYAELLLSKGAFINSKDNKGHTPLIESVSAPTSNMAEFLICNNADILCREYCGHTAEEIAANSDRPDVKEVIRAAILIREKCLAFASVEQPRLGAGSPVRSFDPEVVRMILESSLGRTVLWN
jgi:hypothetical protein